MSEKAEAMQLAARRLQDLIEEHVTVNRHRDAGELTKAIDDLINARIERRLEQLWRWAAEYPQDPTQR